MKKAFDKRISFRVGVKKVGALTLHGVNLFGGWLTIGSRGKRVQWPTGARGAPSEVEGDEGGGAVRGGEDGGGGGDAGQGRHAAGAGGGPRGDDGAAERFQLRADLGLLRKQLVKPSSRGGGGGANPTAGELGAVW